MASSYLVLYLGRYLHHLSHFLGTIYSWTLKPFFPLFAVKWAEMPKQPSFLTVHKHEDFVSTYHFYIFPFVKTFIPEALSVFRTFLWVLIKCSFCSQTLPGECPAGGRGAPVSRGGSRAAVAPGPNPARAPRLPRAGCQGYFQRGQGYFQSCHPSHMNTSNQI